MKFLIYDSSFCPNNISLQKYAAKILCFIVCYFSISAKTYYHKFSSLKQHKFIIVSHSSVVQEPSWLGRFLCFRFPMGKLRLLACLDSFIWRLQERLDF